MKTRLTDRQLYRTVTLAILALMALAFVGVLLLTGRL